jgi:hypothetical protein
MGFDGVVGSASEMTRMSGFRMIGLATLASGLLAASPAAAVLLDFEEFVHGQEIASSQGVTISTINYTGPELGLAFDTHYDEWTSDTDLLQDGGWSGGNLAPSTDLGIILIIQEHTDSCSGSAPNRFCTDADDEGSRPAGDIEFDLSGVDGGVFYYTSFDLVDVEDEMAELGYVEFCLGAVCYADVIEFGDGVLPGVTWGDRTANRAANVGIGKPFDTLRFYLGGSGGLDNVAAVVPEPGAATLFAIGCAITGAALRRRLRA